MNLIPQNNALINARIVEKDSLWSEGIDQTYSLQLCAISIEYKKIEVKNSDMMIVSSQKYFDIFYKEILIFELQAQG